jgi:hypothetical protein
MTVTGKLCRNSFSTINLSHEDGGSKAGFEPSAQVPSLREHVISLTTILGLLLHAQALCIQKAWERA